MKVTGPNVGPSAQPPDAAGEPAVARDPGKAEAKNKVGAGETTATEGSGQAFAERLAGTGTGSPAVPTASPPRGADATSQIAADLAAGRLPARAAVEKVLEQVLARQLGPDAPAAVREKVRAALQDALENDPLLADKLRQLEG